MFNFLGPIYATILAINGLALLAFTQPALAQAATAGQQPSAFETLVVPMLLMVGVFYFFMMRPQAKKYKAQQEFLRNLKRGDEVITSSGLVGRIEGLTEEFATLEISDGVRVRFLRQQISSDLKSMVAKPANSKQQEAAKNV